jgi:hypothetical protein
MNQGKMKMVDFIKQTHAIVDGDFKSVFVFVCLTIAHQETMGCVKTAID